MPEDQYRFQSKWDLIFYFYDYDQIRKERRKKRKDRSCSFILSSRLMKDMIIVDTEIVNHFSDSDYKNQIDSVHVSLICCPDCKDIAMKKYGHYPKRIKCADQDKKITLFIQRLICPKCHKTHALMPLTLIPGKQILLSDVLNILRSKDRGEDEQIMEENPLINEVDLFRIRNDYRRFWKEKLLFFNKSLMDFDLVRWCVQTFRRVFLQKIQINCTFLSLLNTI